MTELAHDRSEPDPRTPDAPLGVEEKLERDPAAGQDVDRRPPEAAQPEPSTTSGAQAAEDLVVEEGVNEGVSDIAAE